MPRWVAGAETPGIASCPRLSPTVAGGSEAAPIGGDAWPRIEGAGSAQPAASAASASAAATRSPRRRRVKIM